MQLFKSHPSSYRDPSGFLFYRDDILYRQVNKVFSKDFDFFVNKGLYQHLVNKKILVQHQAIHKNLTDTSEWYQTLQPEVLPFISYPYEWCFDMLKDAALLTLQAAKEALEYGMMLKDASAYNVQFYKGRMMFIDTLSFEIYDEQKPWIAYRQFCEHFYAPLALMHYLKQPLQNMLLAYPEGIPLSLAKKLLPFKSRFSLNSYLHLHLHAAMSGNASKNKKTTKPFSKQKMKNLLQSLEDGISSFALSKPSGVWSGYYEEAFQRKDYIADKKEIIRKWTASLPFKTVLDAGANEGEFSELLSKTSQNIISVDSDHYSINQLYNIVKQKSILNIQPLIIDFSCPSPFIGINNRERTSFIERTKTDLILALALIHHLAIGKNIPFEKNAKMFSALGKNLIIEFVPKDDEKIKLMLGQKRDVYSWYTEEEFIRGFEKEFSIAERRNIGNSGRTLFLMKAHANENPASPV